MMMGQKEIGRNRREILCGFLEKIVEVSLPSHLLPQTLL